MRPLLVILAVLATSAAVPPRTSAEGTKHATYLNLADSLRGPFEAVSAGVRTGLTTGGWEVLAEHDVAPPPGACAFRARVFVLHEARYAQQILAYGPHAAFALPIRAVLYEDEAGTHLAVVNPLSITRTIVSESGCEAAAQSMLSGLTRAASGSVQGRFVTRSYGQVRERGLIGRTMGVMAGGPFRGKIEDVLTAPGATNQDVARVASQVWRGLSHGAGRGRWQLRGVYRLDLSAQGVVVIGVSGSAMEAKSFAIVGAGGDARRSGYACPGLAHAAAYPIEIVVYGEHGRVHVSAIDAMYRMKLYFEDAGKMKFAAHMTMPGSIEEEIRSLILAEIQ